MNKKNISENGRKMLSKEKFLNIESENNEQNGNLNHNENKREKFNEYDSYKIKHIIRENLKEQNKIFPEINRNKFENFINDKIDIESYLLDKEKKEVFLQSQNFSLENSDSIMSNEIYHANPFSIANSKKNNHIEEINQLELDAMNKAKELDYQIREINTKRIELIIKDFKEKLIEESKEEFEFFYKNLQDEFKIALMKINEAQSTQFDQINELQNQINDYSDMLKSISHDLKEQKVLLNSNLEKYLDKMEKEKNATVEKYKSDMNNFIHNRVKIFENYLKGQMNK